MVEVDEELYRSRSTSPAKINVTKNNSILKSTHYEPHQILVNSTEMLKTESPATEKIQRFVENPEPESEKECSSTSTSSILQEEFVKENCTYDENYLNSLDGVGKQKFIKNSMKAMKRRKSLNSSFNVEKVSSSKEEEFCKLNNSVDVSVDTESKKVSLTTDRAKLRESQDGSTNDTTQNKPPEPFWVKH